MSSYQPPLLCSALVLGILPVPLAEVLGGSVAADRAWWDLLEHGE